MGERRVGESGGEWESESGGEWEWGRVRVGGE